MNLRAQGFLAFIAGLCATVWICLFVMDVQERQMVAAFQRDSDKIVRDTNLRLQTYFDALLSLKGMLSAGEDVSRVQLARFIGALELGRRYPGFQAIQFVRAVPEAQLAAYSAAVRADTSLAPGGYPQFAVHPGGAQGQHYIIDFTEPLQGNESAFGLDLAALPPHLRALEMARDSGHIVATGRVTLVQDAHREAGFVVRSAVYRQGLPLDTVAQRRAALRGFVAIVFRVRQLMPEVIEAPMLSHMTVQINDDGYFIDAGAAPPVNLLYDSAADGAPRGAPLPQLLRRGSLNVGQRQWTLSCFGYEGARYGRQHAVVALIGLAGLIISTLIAALITAWQRRRALADQLRSTLDEQRAFQDSATVGIGLFSHGFILRCNRGLEEMMGYRPGELSRRPTDLLLAPAALSAKDPFSSTAAGRGQRELELVRRDGSALWCTVNGKLLDPDNIAQGCVWVIHDISDRKRTEAALAEARHGMEHSLEELARQKASVEQAHGELSAVLDTLKQAQTNLITSEKMASLGALVAGIAHELNTPIGNSLLTASALDDMVEQFGRQFAAGAVKRSTLEAHLAGTRQACAIMTGSLGRAADLITSFKQVAVDQTSDKRRPFQLGDVLHDTLATYAAQLRRANCEVRLAVPAGLAFESYPGSIGQVLSNLLNNALLHAFEGRAAGLITISAREAGEQVTLVFRDDGVGMAPKTLHQVFDPFFTTKMGQGGSGLGMNIVYNIVTGMLKGSITVESEPGCGTAITVTIPKVVPERAAA